MTLRLNNMAEFNTLKQRDTKRTVKKNLRVEKPHEISKGENKYKQQLELIFLSLKCEPEREYRFSKSRRWRFDYAFPKYQIAIEYEGLPLQVAKSRHTTISGFAGDCEKYSEAAILGWRIIRVNALSVESGLAHDMIQRIVKQIGQDYLKEKMAKMLCVEDNAEVSNVV